MDSYSNCIFCTINFTHGHVQISAIIANSSLLFSGQFSSILGSDIETRGPLHTRTEYNISIALIMLAEYFFALATTTKSLKNVIKCLRLVKQRDDSIKKNMMSFIQRMALWGLTHYKTLNNRFKIQNCCQRNIQPRAISVKQSCRLCTMCDIFISIPLYKNTLTWKLMMTKLLH